MYALRLLADGRVLEVVLAEWDMSQKLPRVNEMPPGPCLDYLYRDGAYLYDPVIQQPEPQPSADDRRDAQLAYTAMMTDTLLPEPAQDKETSNV